MQLIDIFAQALGIVGFLLQAFAFQAKNNKVLFLMQGASGFMYFVSFLLLGVYSAAFVNLVVLLRGVLYANPEKKVWKLITVLILVSVSYVISLMLIIGDPLQIILSTATIIAVFAISVVQWQRDGVRIRYIQLYFSSPVWIVHNIINFTVGGILCEVFTMVSILISFKRHGKEFVG